MQTTAVSLKNGDCCKSIWLVQVGIRRMSHNSEDSFSLQWEEIIDSRLIGKCNMGEAGAMAAIAYKCVHKSARKKLHQSIMVIQHAGQIIFYSEQLGAFQIILFPSFSIDVPSCQIFILTSYTEAQF